MTSIVVEGGETAHKGKGQDDVCVVEELSEQFTSAYTQLPTLAAAVSFQAQASSVSQQDGVLQPLPWVSGSSPITP